MDQSLAVMLWQLSNGKISFIVLIPARVFLIRMEESVPDVEEDLEKSVCSALPHMYWK